MIRQNDLLKTLLEEKIEGRRARGILWHKWENNLMRWTNSSLSAYTTRARERARESWRSIEANLHYEDGSWLIDLQLHFVCYRFVLTCFLYACIYRFPSSSWCGAGIGDHDTATLGVIWYFNEFSVHDFICCSAVFSFPTYIFAVFLCLACFCNFSPFLLFVLISYNF